MLPIADNLIYNKHTICQSGGGEDVGIYGIQDRGGICITYFWMEIGDKWSLFANDMTKERNMIFPPWIHVQ